MLTQSYSFTLQTTEYLALNDNAFDKKIPPQIGNLTQVRTLLLSGNEFSGEVPPELGRLTTLGKISCLLRLSVHSTRDQGFDTGPQFILCLRFCRNIVFGRQSFNWQIA